MKYEKKPILRKMEKTTVVTFTVKKDGKSNQESVLKVEEFRGFYGQRHLSKRRYILVQ